MSFKVFSKNFPIFSDFPIFNEKLNFWVIILPKFPIGTSIWNVLILGTILRQMQVLLSKIYNILEGLYFSYFCHYQEPKLHNHDVIKNNQDMA